MQKQFEEIKQLNKNNEMILKKLGLDSMEHNCMMLKKYALFKSKTKLSDIDETILNEYQFRQKSEILKNRQLQMELDYDIRKLEKQKEESLKLVKDLEKCLEVTSSLPNSDKNVEKSKLTKEKYTKKIQEQVGKLTKTDIDFDGLVKKVALAESILEKKK